MRKLLVTLVVLLAATLSFSGAPPDRLPTLTAPAEARMLQVVAGTTPAPPAGGTFEIVGTPDYAESGSTSSSLNITLSTTPEVGDLLLVGVITGGATTTGGSMTDNASTPNTYTQQVSIQNGTGYAFAAFWTTVVQYTRSGLQIQWSGGPSAGWPSLVVARISNPAASPIGDTGSLTNNSTSITPALDQTGAAKNLCFGLMTYGWYGNALGIGNSYTLIRENEDWPYIWGNKSNTSDDPAFTVGSTSQNAAVAIEILGE